MVLGSNPVAATWTSDIAPVWSKEFLDNQATIERRFTLKRVRDMIRTYSQLKITDCFYNVMSLFFFIRNRFIRNRALTSLKIKKLLERF